MISDESLKKKKYMCVLSYLVKLTHLQPLPVTELEVVVSLSGPFSQHDSVIHVMYPVFEYKRDETNKQCTLYTLCI